MTIVIFKVFMFLNGNHYLLHKIIKENMFFKFVNLNVLTIGVIGILRIGQ